MRVGKTGGVRPPPSGPPYRAWLRSGGIVEGGVAIVVVRVSVGEPARAGWSDPVRRLEEAA
eukprot:3370807-Pyramimonas_sp.AAC.1